MWIDLSVNADDINNVEELIVKLRGTTQAYLIVGSSLMKTVGDTASLHIALCPPLRSGSAHILFPYSRRTYGNMCQALWARVAEYKYLTVTIPTNREMSDRFIIGKLLRPLATIGGLCQASFVHAPGDPIVTKIKNIMESSTSS